MVSLGLVIFVMGIFIYLGKVKAILNWEKPINLNEIHSFLGLTWYYRSLIEEYLTIATSST